MIQHLDLHIGFHAAAETMKLEVVMAPRRTVRQPVRSILVTLHHPLHNRAANDRAATSPVEGPHGDTRSIVQRMVESNKDRADRLPDCTSRRHYHLQFHGLGRSMEADMEVEVLDHGSASSNRFKSPRNPVPMCSSIMS